MQELWLDFETYYDDEYSLKRMTPAEYIADDRFEALGCAFVWDGGEEHVEGPEIPAYLAEIDWDNTCAIAHNSLFDMLILSMRYGIFPTKYGDTLAMARNWISHSTGGSSLKECCQYFGLPAKWDTVAKTKGVNYQALCRNPALRQEVRDYALDDTRKCKAIYELMLADGFPKGELDTIDIVVRMAAYPQFEVDMGILYEHLGEVKAKKEALLQRCGMDNRDNLMSDAAFAGLLLMAEPDLILPQKISKKTGLMQFAFAKNDRDFKVMLEHPNPDVQALVAARIGHKSTLEETRTERFIAIGRVIDKFPIPLKYSGAHTHRFSGDWSINAQNLPRDGNLRRALVAPKGMKVVSIDASQIEARINATISGQHDLVEAFREGRDVYCEFATDIYQRTITAADKLERFVGKTGILSLGYQSSSIVFQNMLRVQGNVTMPLVDASKIVDLYRGKYSAIVRNWYRVHREVLTVLGSYEGQYSGLHYGPCVVHRNRIWLPNGNKLNYRDLAMMFNEDGSNGGWMFKRGNRPIYTYGAKVVENVVQALAFVHIMAVAKRVDEMMQGTLDLAHQVHDELIYIVEDHLAEQVGRLVQREMAKTPEWMPDLPLAASVKIGQNYGDVKEVRG
jgi:DNA polymerase